MKKFKTADLVYIALCAVLIAVCSWISIPAAVPFTLQTFAVFCTLALLGGQRGTAAVAVYILLGAFGVPVFAGFGAGVGVLLGATGGYIVGFLFIGLLVWLASVLFGESRAAAAAAMLLGLFVCYAFGTAWFMTVYARGGGAVTLGAALGWCVLPFLLPDLVKLALALALARRLRPLLRA